MDVVLIIAILVVIILIFRIELAIRKNRKRVELLNKSPKSYSASPAPNSSSVQESIWLKSNKPIDAPQVETKSLEKRAFPIPPQASYAENPVFEAKAKAPHRSFKSRRFAEPIKAPKESEETLPQQIYGRSNTSSDGGLADFIIVVGREEEESKNPNGHEWIKPGKNIQVHGKSIKKGFFYLGGNLRSLDGYGADAALVDDKLNIIHKHMTFVDESLDYWPKYSTISASCRGAFLDWLASDRDNPDVPLGYVFIYFYGLERRVLIDSQEGLVSDEEFVSIRDEIIRLQQAYEQSNSFLNYTNRLLEAMFILRPSVIEYDIQVNNGRYDSLIFKYLLAKTIKAEDPINPDLALRWLQSSDIFRFTTPAVRCKKEFRELFKIKYHEKFGTGMVVKPNKTKLNLHYHPASITLRGITLSQEDLPDPSALKAPLNKLIPIASDCLDLLDSFSRYLGKKGNSRNDLEAVLMLPDELANESTSETLSQFMSWAQVVIAGNDGISSSREFWQHMGANLPEKINKKEAELMANIASKAGFGIAPDINFHNSKPAPNGKIVLFPVGHEQGFTPSKAFNDVGMALRLGSMVATSDGKTDEAEQNVLESLINDDPKLNFTEKRSLHAYLKWRLKSPPDAAGLKARIEKLSAKEKGFVSHLLIGVALADGKIDTSEIKQLEKLYASLGLDRSQVSTDLHGQSSSHSPKPSKASTDDSGEVTGFKLNEELISLHEAQTKDVQSMLHSIFAEEDEPETVSVETDDEDEKSDFDGLDKAHQALFDALIKEPEWPRQAVEDMCSQYGLMIDGAIEHINDWAFEVFDAPILDDEGDILVDQELVQELQK